MKARYLAAGAIGVGAAALFLCRGRPAAWLDEFTNYEPRWDWGYQSGTGYQLVDQERAIIGIRPQAGQYYSDCALRTATIYPSGRMGAVLRCTDSGANPAVGTRGWGFWDGRTGAGSTNAAWFWAASEESAPVLRGFQANVLRDGLGVYQQVLPGIDITQDHEYAVEIGGGSRFYVDGVLVAETVEQPSGRQRVEFWIDNQSIAVDGTRSVHPVLADQAMLIDWASYSRGVNGA